MLERSGYDPELFDIEAHYDRKINRTENVKNVARMHGINLSGRDRGVDFLKIQEMERKKTRKIRSDPMYQTGRLSNQTWDLRFQAMPPGKRFSRKTGRRYYERRENRSDRGYMI